MNEFTITADFQNRKFRMNVKRVFLMADKERWEVTAKNHVFLIDSNRPLMAKKNLDHLAWDWTLVSGNCPQYFLKEIMQAIRKTINWMGKIDR
jgi:hypothetical protein